MPELKNLFIKGKMNKDLDERLVPQGEYRDALNVSVSYSEGSGVGALQNILGNQLRTRYNLGGETPILNFPPNATCIGTVRDTENDKIYWFGTSATADYIAELDPFDNSVDIILCDAYTLPSTRILNFSTSNLITGVAVLDGVLYFTDDLNEPRQVDIEHWRSVTGNDLTTTSTYLSDDRISLYKKGPLNAPTFETIKQSLRGGVGTLGGSTVTFTKNFFGLEIDDIFSGNFSVDPNYQVGDVIEMKNSFQGEYGENIESILRIEITVHSDPGTSFTGKLLSKTSEIEDASAVYTCLLEEDEPLFELKFAKFAYRYKYNNGQFSVMSPFSLPAFIPGNFEYNGQEGYNLGMVNTVRQLKLEGWITAPAINNYQADIEEIEILYKDSVSANVYIVEALRKTENSNTEFPSVFEVKDEQIFKAVQSNQILRPFDSIPKKAKALEITGNRLIFGNYLQNFNVTTNPSFTISTISRTDTSQKFSVKSGRTYQLGIVGQDEYGRQTPVFTDTTGVIKIDGSKADLNLAFRVNASFPSLPAELTHYKYYIKEVSNPYYNICVSNIYEDDETGYIYCAFPSSETNKVSEDDILILKKQSGNNAYKITNNSKFKVLDKSPEPPNFLSTKQNIVYETTSVAFAPIYGSGAIQTTKKPGSTPVPGHNTIQLERAFRTGDDADADVSSQFVAQCTTGAKLRFKRSGTNNKSNIYTIKTFSIEPDGGQEEVELTFEEQFGEDVNVIYTSNADNAEYQCQIEFVKSEDDTGNPEYAGKFFIKLNNSSQLKQALIGDFDESSLNTVATTVNVDAYDDSGENRLYWYTRVSTTTSTIPSQPLSGITLPAGFHIVLQTQENLDDGASDYQTDPFGPALTQGNYIRFSGYTSLDSNFDDISEYPNYKIVEALVWDDNNRRNYALKFNKLLEYNLPSTGQLDPNTSNRRIQFRVDAREPSLEGSKTPENPPVFEIEPKDGVLDIYYETEKTYPISNLSTPTELDYTNCISFNNGVESDRIRDDFNAPIIGKGVRVSTVFEDNYSEERVKSGLIFSQIYNGKNGINRLNQFIIAENITKEANPIYGSIQKLNTRDTDLTLLCDDAILKVPARKDLLFQADGNPQVTSTDRFLGTIIPYQGNYGCQHPESFADHIYRAYFVDRTRGKVLRLSGDGITEISNYGMKDYFKDKLVAETGYMFGSYDENKDNYNVSLPVENTVVAFSESVNGWPTRKSFYEMESGISLNNMYYTFKDGKIFSHDNETRNTFYGTKTDSEVTFYLNGNPGNIKNFRTLNYQGDSGWVIKKDLLSDPRFFGLKTDKQNGAVDTFVEKEGIYYNYISGNLQVTKDNLDLKALNVQGLGTPISISGSDATFTDLNNAIQVGDTVFNNSNDSIKTVQSILGNTITLDSPPTNAFSYFVKDNRFNTSGIVGYYAEITMTNTATDKKELYSVGSEVSLSS